MDNPRTVFLDIDLNRQDTQTLASAEAIAAFFARLGYNTEAHTTQTPGNLGITADSTYRPIKKIELIANQEGLFQVYLFELQSITVAHTLALARAFRNRAGNYLLVLTSDYDRLDFVFLERELPTATGTEQLLSDKQSAIRPRVLKLETVADATKSSWEGRARKTIGVLFHAISPSLDRKNHRYSVGEQFNAHPLAPGDSSDYATFKHLCDALALLQH